MEAIFSALEALLQLFLAVFDFFVHITERLLVLFKLPQEKAENVSKVLWATMVFMIVSCLPILSLYVLWKY